MNSVTGVNEVELLLPCMQKILHELGIEVQRFGQWLRSR